MKKLIPTVWGWACVGKHLHPLGEKCPDDYIPDVFNGAGMVFTYEYAEEEEE